MHRISQILAGTLAALLPTVGAWAAPPPEEARAMYVVQVEDLAAGARALADVGAVPDEEIDRVFEGFTVELTDAQAAELAATDGVEGVVEETVTYAHGSQSPATWGLDRIDQQGPGLNNVYTYPDSAGTGVRVYVLDTGLTPEPTQFANVLPGRNWIGFNREDTLDCHGHGTHVAGTVASKTYGVAKSATIIPLRVLGCDGRGSSNDIVHALNWIASNHPVGAPGVVNMSLGTVSNAAVDAAVAGMVEVTGLPVVSSAGNDGDDACLGSPGRAPQTLTIASSDRTDTRASNSSHGTCVDLFAPGVQITSVDYEYPTLLPRTMSGTSMASPHAAGVAALFLAEYPNATPADVEAALKSSAIPAITTNAPNTTNLLLQLPQALSPSPAPADVAVTVTDDQATITWSPAPGATAYQLHHRIGISTPWTIEAPQTTQSATMTLAEASTYQFAVTSKNALGTSARSTIVTVTTDYYQVPATPTNLTATPTSPTTADVTWTTGRGTVNSILRHRVAGTTEWTSQTLTATHATLTVAPNTTYQVQVQATNTLGYSAPATTQFTTAPLTPAAPAGLTATADGTTVNLNWEPTPTAATYQVHHRQHGATTWQTLDPQTGTSASITGLHPGRTFEFAVDATNVTGTSELSAPVTATTTYVTAPPVPTNLTATVGATWLRFTWTVSSDTTGHIVNYRVLGESAWNTTTAMFISFGGGATPVTYEVRVAATNPAGTSAFTDIVRGTTPTVAPTIPLAPVVTAEPAGSGARVRWSQANGAATYEVHYRTQGATTWQTLPPQAETYADITGLTPDVTYEIAVTATNPAGTSPLSAIVTVIPTNDQPPAQVTGVTVSNVQATTLTVAWQPVPYATSYAVQFRRSTGPWVTIITPTTTAALTGLGPQTTYQVRVVARNSFGEGPASSTATATTAEARGTLTGTVTSAGVQLAGATVTATGERGTFTATTATTGGYTLSVPTGTYTLAFSAPGHRTQYHPATLVAAQAKPVTLSAGATVTAGADLSSTTTPLFPDVGVGHAFYAEIDWLATSGITAGYSDGTFRPSEFVGRQAMAAFLYRAAGSPPFTAPATASFTDVPTTHPFYKEIEWLAATGITTGYADGRFRPADTVGRQAMAAFLYRAAGSPAYTPPATASFTDVPTTHPFYKEIEWLAATGITTGYADGRFRPTDFVGRQAMAAFLYRADRM